MTPTVATVAPAPTAASRTRRKATRRRPRPGDCGFRVLRDRLRDVDKRGSRQGNELAGTVVTSRSAQPERLHALCGQAADGVGEEAVDENQHQGEPGAGGGRGEAAP